MKQVTSLPKSRLVILPEQQHIAMGLNPDLFISSVQDFLST